MKRRKPLAATRSRSSSRNGRFPTGANALGRVPRARCKRVPSPPQRTMTSSSRSAMRERGVRLIEDDLAALPFEPERNAQQLAELLVDPGMAFRRCEEEHESSAARTQELAAQRAGRLGRCVYLVDRWR